MYTQFNTSSVKGGNTGSSGNLVNYLDKEQQNEWFNDESKKIDSSTVKTEIDRYGKGQLGKEQWKFVEVEYNPSQQEQQQIIYESTGRNDVKEWNELSSAEQEKVKADFKEYVIEAQTIQAKNYNRENIKNGADLKYYGKVETQRKYKGTDQEVKQGKAKQGDLKKGLNLHAHIVQSRKAKNKKTKLSPESKHKKESSKNVIKQGFNRNEFYNKIEQKFDEKFDFKRDVKQSFEWQKANKLNRLDEKKNLENKQEQPHSEKRQEYLREYREYQKTEKLEQTREKEKQQNKNQGYSY
jgi:hypothetical protein